MTEAPETEISELDAYFAVDFLKSFDPAGRHNLVAIVPDGKVIGRTFPPGSWEKIREFVETWNGERNIYFSVNEPRPDAPDKKLSGEDIAFARAVHVDLDVSSGMDLASGRVHALARLKGAPPPTFTLDSGGGVQAFWRFDKKLPIGNGDWLEALNAGAGEVLGGDPAVKNVDRIMRLPHTINLPTAAKLKKHPGRQPRKSELLASDGPTYAQEAIARAFPAIKSRVVKTKDKTPIVELDLPEHVELAKHYLIHQAPSAELGNGSNDETYRIAAKVRGFGVSEATALELMLDHWNETKSSPPWPADDLAKMVENAYRYATGAWGGDTAAGEFSDLDLSDLDIGVSPFVKGKLEEAQRAAKSARKSRILDYDAMQALADPEWLIPGLLLKHSSALMFGKSNAFKSFLALDAALSVATGRPWHGAPVARGRVVYVASEGQIGIARKRIPGWYDHHDIPKSERYNLGLLPEPSELDDPKEVDRLLADLAGEGGADLVILDIFGSMSKGSETEDTTARPWVNGLRRLVKEGTVLTVAHTGWADTSRARMHTHTWGSFDTRLIVEGDKDKLTAVLSVDRHKDADSRGKWGFRMEPTCGTLVPILDGDVAERAKRGRLSATNAKALALFEEAKAAHGEIRHGDNWPMCQVVAVEKWKEACGGGAALTDSEKRNTWRMAFQRAHEALVEAGYLKERDGYAWSRAEEIA